MIALLYSIPMALCCYAVMPITLLLAVGWFVTGLVEFTLAGAVAGLIYRK